jgi:hypothetical protein
VDSKRRCNKEESKDRLAKSSEADREKYGHCPEQNREEGGSALRCPEAEETEEEEAPVKCCDEFRELTGAEGESAPCIEMPDKKAVGLPSLGKAMTGSNDSLPRLLGYVS